VSFAYFATKNIDVSKIKFDDVIEETNKYCDDTEDEIKFALFAALNEEPSSYQEAINSEESKKWKTAIKEEIDSMVKNEVWRMVKRPKYMKDGCKANTYN